MSQRFGLLIGVGQYLHLGESGRLYGPQHDVRAMADLLIRQFQFPTLQVRCLLDAEATKARILGALDALTESAGDGDQVVIHFSGHGSQVADPDGDEPDGLDETLVPFDARPPGHPGAEDELSEILDHELAARLAAFDANGVFVMLILDCCHAGHAHRIRPDIRIRGLPTRRVTARQTRRRNNADGLFKTKRQRQVILAACQDDQLAGERFTVAGRPYGDWSWALIQAAHRGPPRASVGELFDLAAEHMALRNPEQSPQLYGDRDRLIFGAERLPRPRFPRARKYDDSWSLQLGAVHGLQLGSRWRLLTPSTLQPLAEAELEQVFPFHGALRTADEKDELADRDVAWAQEIEPSYGDGRLPVRLVDLEGWRPQDLANLRRRIAGSPWLLEEGLFEEHLPQKARPGADRSVRIWPDLSVRFALGNLLPGSDPADGFSALIERLERKARALLGLSLKNRSPSRLENALSIELLRRRGKNRPWREARAENGIYPFQVGDRLGLRIAHDFQPGLFPYLLDFGVTDHISQVHPEPGAAELLYPELQLAVGLVEDDDLEFQFPDGFGQRFGFGFLKIFATTRPVDFRWITSPEPPPSNRISSRLESLLSLGRARFDRADGDDWTTVQFAFRLEGDQS